jgi:DNA-binding CsgD family transcriptional regulator
MDDTKRERLIESLYDVALGAGGWEQPMNAMAGLLDAGHVHLMVWDSTCPQPAHSQTCGIDERMEGDYRAHYGAIDPRRLLVAGLPEGHWFACHHRFDERAVARSEFWQDYLIPGGVRYLLGTRLTRRDGMDVFFGIHRALGQPAFDDADIAFMRGLTGHFQRAAQLWLQTDTLRAQARALDAVEQAVLATDVEGRLRFVNRYAEALLRGGAPLVMRRGRVTALQPAEALQLTAALRACAASGQAQALRLGASSVAVLRIAEDSVLAAGLGASRLLLLVTPDRHRRVAPVRQVMQLFQATAAEARLARALAAGESLDSYAEQAGLSPATVKTQLGALFRKTGTRRQPELVRLLATLPAARD